MLLLLHPWFLPPTVLRLCHRINQNHCFEWFAYQSSTNDISAPFLQTVIPRSILCKSPSANQWVVNLFAL